MYDDAFEPTTNAIPDTPVASSLEPQPPALPARPNKQSAMLKNYIGAKTPGSWLQWFQHFCFTGGSAHIHLFCMPIEFSQISPANLDAFEESSANFRSLTPPMKNEMSIDSADLKPAPYL